MAGLLKPELLSPAGDWEAMRAAVANGADAVYFGLSNFNARHRATNFTLEELPKVMEYLHGHNVRGYLTLNTLIFSDELADAAEFVSAAASAGVDALIVQDLGLARLIHRLTPTLAIHGSTQMTLTEPRGIEFVKQLGVSRVILARELSTSEIERIAVSTDVPVEVFVHGALCVAYSGQCLTSEALGGRSANRGQCAQACRLPYELIVDGQKRDMGDKAYLLSPQDLAAYDLIGELARVGVVSFKIEGRLKSAHYVAATTQTYRAAVDAAISDLKFEISDEQLRDLSQSFSRGFTHGFLDGVNHQQLVHARFPKSRGVRIGTVTEMTRDGIIVQIENWQSKIENILKPGDGVVFDEGHPEQDEQGGRVMTVKPARIQSENRKSKIESAVEISFRPGDINLSAIAVGAIVWKTDDPAMRKRLEHSFARDVVAQRVPLSAKVCATAGRPLVVELTDPQGNRARVESDQSLELAQRHPLTVELLREQLGRMGQTPFELAEVRLVGTSGDGPADPVMVPKSVLNDLRRRAVDMLLSQRNSRERHTIANPSALGELRAEISNFKFENRNSDPQIENRKSKIENVSVLVRTLDQLRAILDWQPPAGQRPELIYADFEDIRRYDEAVELSRKSNMPIALATLRVVKPAEEGLLRQIAECGPDGVLVRNLAAVSFYREQLPALPLYGDYSLNIANELTAAIFAESGLKRMVPSYDLNWDQLAALLRRFPASHFETVVHQHMPMFHMEHCIFAHTLSNGKDYRDCGRPCDRHRVDLTDRVGQAHPLIPDVGCRNTLFNASAQSAAEYVPRMKEMGLRHFRVELLRETPAEAMALLDRYARVIAGQDDGRRTWRQLRVLNQLGVTRGTLEHV